MPSAYENLKNHFRLLSNIGGATSILYMDSMTAMKPGSDADRSEQMMALATASQRLLSDPAVETWLNDAESNAGALPAGDQRNLALMRRNWTIATALPEHLVRKKAQLETEGNNLHTKHRDSGNWAAMKPVYQQAFDVSREIGTILKDRLGFSTPYEALLDQFSPGLKINTVDHAFALLEQHLGPMIAEAMTRQKNSPSAIPVGKVPVQAQFTLNYQLLRALGFDENRGVFYSGDMHPLSGGTPDDSRLTTHFSEDDFLDALYTTAHETGHSLYEQATPLDWRYQPAGHTMGMDIHESQSMVFERHVCKIPEFIDYLSEQAQLHFGRTGDPALTSQNLSRTIFRVEPSFIRIYADELTYPGHIILRYKLERDIIDGKLSIDDLPDAWNDGMKKIFGIVPPDASKGHMQDVHWPTLSIGYFPAYTLGAMGAAQFFEAAVRAKPRIPGEIRQGQFSTVREWLRENVHAKGFLLNQDQLFTAATGETLNAQYYLNHLSRQYLGRDFKP